MKKLLLIATILIGFGASAQWRLVKDIVSGSSHSLPGSFIEYNGRLYFSAIQSGTRVVFATDGTSNGTVALRLGSPTGAFLWNPHGTVGFNIFNSELYFDYKSTGNGFAYIGKISGTSDVATQVLSLTNLVSSNDSRFSNAIQIGNKAIFNPVAAISSDGVEPQVLDLITPLNSSVLKNINPIVTTNSNPMNFTSFNNSVYFSAFDATNGTELWKTDGTNVGTILFLDIAPGVVDSNPDQFNVIIPTGDNTPSLTFVATTVAAKNVPGQGRELYKTTGVGGTISIIKNIHPTGDSNPTSVTKIGNSLYFAADNGTNGNEIWKSDGVSAGTVMIKDIN